LICHFHPSCFFPSFYCLPLFFHLYFLITFLYLFFFSSPLCCYLPSSSLLCICSTLFAAGRHTDRYWSLCCVWGAASGFSGPTAWIPWTYSYSAGPAYIVHYCGGPLQGTY
jgi:hypothetical protein